MNTPAKDATFDELSSGPLPAVVFLIADWKRSLSLRARQFSDDDRRGSAELHALAMLYRALDDHELDLRNRIGVETRSTLPQWVVERSF